MPNSITVIYLDGSKEEFPHKGRAGGSWTKTIRYEGSFAIIKDEWGNETSIPAALIREIKVVNHY
jgi:hypothetical protein